MFKRSFEIFWRFLVLGCFSFGGPAAHIGYFKKLFVEQLHWLDDKKFGDMLSLSQFLPGPGSSQLGFAIGMNRGGLLGGIAAFIGFTLPSFLLLYFLAINIANVEYAWLDGIIHGLKLLAVVVVADACISMFSSFCKNKISQFIAVLTTVIILVAPSLTIQLCLLLAVAVIGMVYLSPKQATQLAMKQDGNHVNLANDTNNTRIFSGKVILILSLFALPFAVMFLAPVLGIKQPVELQLFNQFYQAGSFVFGGGHVVLPLLQQSIGDALTNEQFLMGYASAQAVPGPMFTIATFLGANLTPQSALTGALVATLAVFLPGFILLIALHTMWHRLADKPKVAGAIASVNAAVVGLLIAALYHPVFTSGVMSATDMALVCVGFYLLRSVKVPILLLVAFFIACGLIIY